MRPKNSTGFSSPGFTFALNNVLLRREAARSAHARALAMFSGGVLVAGLAAGAMAAVDFIAWPSLPGPLWLLPLAGIGLYFLIAALIKYKTTELAVTNKRVITKIGLISRHTLELNLSKAESIQINQSLLGRLCNYGSLQINGTGTAHTPINGIRSPLEFRRQFMEAQDQAALRYGIENPRRAAGAEA